MIKFLITTTLFLFIFGCGDNLTTIDNAQKIPLEFKKNSVICPKCNMPLESKKYTAQVITKDNKTHFFDDIGCMILWLKENNIKSNSAKIWVYSLDSKRYIDALSAYYSIKDKTPMNYGFGAYEKQKDGFIGFEEMKIKMLRGENLANPRIRKKILGY